MKRVYVILRGELMQGGSVVKVCATGDGAKRTVNGILTAAKRRGDEWHFLPDEDADLRWRNVGGDWINIEPHEVK